MLGNIRYENMTPSDLWKALKQILKWASSPHTHTLSPSPLTLQIWNIKGPESPPAFNTRVKRAAICKSWKNGAHVKAICLCWNPTRHRSRELSLGSVSADGDRHPSSGTFMKTWRLDILQALPNAAFHLRSAKNRQIPSHWCFPLACVTSEKKEYVHQSSGKASV